MLFRSELEQFLAFNFGANFKKDYGRLASEEEKAKYIEQVLLKFSYGLLLKVGAANISQSKVSERIDLNRTMQISVEERPPSGLMMASFSEKAAGVQDPNSHNVSLGEVNLSSQWCPCEKVKFTLTIDEQVHQFAAVDRNMETFEKWCT